MEKGIMSIRCINWLYMDTACIYKKFRTNIIVNLKDLPEPCDGYKTLIDCPYYLGYQK